MNANSQQPVLAGSKSFLDDADDQKYGDPVAVPLKIATPENFKEYGHFVHDLSKAQVIIETWPVKGWRKCCQGTGVNAGLREKTFEHSWLNDSLTVRTKGEDTAAHYTGRLPKGVPVNDRSHVLVREANYHPDGGQMFFPLSPAGPFVMALAQPGDDVRPEDFVAFYFDGSHGVQIKTGVWHATLCNIVEKQEINSQQSAVFACILLDTVAEFGKYLKVPLKPELAMAK